jgi:hypothetical protein
LEDSLRLVKDTARAVRRNREMAIRLEWIRGRRIKMFAAVNLPHGMR